MAQVSVQRKKGEKRTKEENRLDFWQRLPPTSKCGIAINRIGKAELMDCVILECGRKRGPIKKIKRPTETVQERPVR